MNILAIETSTKHFSLAVGKNGKVLTETNTHLTDVLSAAIIPSIEKILKRHKWTVKDINCLVVGLGPGSFTSLRVGLATVKAMAYATLKPVVGISSLDALAMNVSAKENNPICVMADARRNLVYACLYERSDTSLKRNSDYLLLSPEDLLKKIKKPTIFVGDGAILYKEKILSRLKSALFAGPKAIHPKAGSLIVLAQERIKQKKFDDANTLVPLYLYPDDCQVGRT